jgi:hypothetical protein
VAPRCTAALRRQFVHRDILVRERQLSALEKAISSLSLPLTEDSLKRAVEEAAPAMLEEFKRKIEECQFDSKEPGRMREIVRCLCLIQNTAVCELANWYECPLSTPMIGGVLGSGGQAIEHIFQMEVQLGRVRRKLGQIVGRTILGNARKRSTETTHTLEPPKHSFTRTPSRRQSS